MYKPRLIMTLHHVRNMLFRVLPSIKHNCNFKKLVNDFDLQRYLKGFHTIQEYDKTYDFFSSRGFDMSTADIVRNERGLAKQKFKDSVATKISGFLDSKNFLKLCNITSSELTYVTFNLTTMVLKGCFPFIEPTVDNIIDSIKKKASMGLPTPRIKKRDLLPEIRHMTIQFKAGKLNVFSLLNNPSVAFSRLQIRVTGIKVRIVEAVNGMVSALQNYPTLWFKSALNLDEGALCIGLTQKQIRSRVNEFSDKYTYCIDYSKWDETRQPILAIIAHEWIIGLITSDPYQIKGFRSMYMHNLILPLYYTGCEFGRRFRGTVSGSGYTTIENSLCNFILVSIIMYRYCRIKGINITNLGLKIIVCGDDLVLGTDIELDTELLFKLGKDGFGADMRLEIPLVEPGINRAFFLGSSWIDDKPYRSEPLLVASIIFGSGNFPQMSLVELISSRSIEIFGNVANCGEFFRRMRFRPLSRNFFFYEQYNPEIVKDIDMTRKYIRDDISTKIRESNDLRGFWYNSNIDSNRLGQLWETR